MERWILYALLGAFFAACVQVLSKPALKTFEPTTVNAARALIMLVFFIGILIYETAIQDEHTLLQPKEGGSFKAGVTFMILGGLAASLSWFFGYLALSLAEVSKTYPIDKLSVAIGVVLAAIFLKEKPTVLNWLGIAVMIIGALLVTHKAKTA